MFNLCSFYERQETIGNAVSFSASAEDVSLEGIGNLLALTSNDEANALSARRYAREFGKPHVFQLRPDRQHERTQLEEKERARIAFEGEPTFADLQERYRQGARLKTTSLTGAYPLSQFRREQPDALILFWGKDGKYQLSRQGKDIPEQDVQVISLAGQAHPS